MQIANKTLSISVTANTTKQVLSTADFTLIGGFAVPDYVGGTWAKITHRWVNNQLSFFSHAGHSQSIDDIIEYIPPDRSLWKTSGVYNSYPVSTQLNYWNSPLNNYSPISDSFSYGQDWIGTIQAATSNTVTFTSPGVSKNQYIGLYLGITSGNNKQTVLTTNFDGNKTFTIDNFTNGIPQPGDSLRLSSWVKKTPGWFMGIFFDSSSSDIYLWNQGSYTSSSYSAMAKLHLNSNNTLTPCGPWFYKDIHSKVAVTGATTLSDNFISLANLPPTAKIGVGHMGGFSISGSPFGPSLVAISPPSCTNVSQVDLNNNTATKNASNVPSTLGAIDGIQVIPTNTLLLYPQEHKSTRPASYISRSMIWDTNHTAFGPGLKVTSVDSITLPGTNHSVGDILTHDPSNIVAAIYPQLQVTSVDSSGGITGVNILNPGVSWSATNNPTYFNSITGTESGFNLTWGEDNRSIVLPDFLPNQSDPYLNNNIQVNNQVQKVIAFKEAGSGQKAVILFASPWNTSITSSTQYILFQDYSRGGTSNTIQLSSSESNVDLTGYFIKIVVGTGTGLCGIENGGPNNPSNEIISYDINTKIATISPPFNGFTSDTTSGYVYSQSTFWDEGTSNIGEFAQLGESSNGDNCHAAVYIEGDNKWGFVAFPYLTKGIGTYYHSTVQSQYIKSHTFIYDPEDLINVSKGNLLSYNVIPNSITEYTSPTDNIYSNIPWSGSFSNISGASYDSDKKELYLMVNNVFYDGSWNRALIFVYSVNC